jgi:hypothetical protein
MIHAVHKFLFNAIISPFHLIVISTLTIGATYLGVHSYLENKLDYNVSSENSTSLVTTERDESYKFTKPLIGFDIGLPAKSLQLINTELNEMVKTNCSNGNLFEASIYLRDLKSGDWSSVNDAETFHPGSLIKVPMLIYYLKEAESNPAILDKKLSVEKELIGLPIQTYTGQQVEYNKVYTVKELLKYMVSYSDNLATYLLNTNCEEEKFCKVFTDLGLPKPSIHDTSYSISAKEYSIFFRVLYNATYLNNEHSDYALSLLTQSTFMKGIAEKLPNGMVIARKFGEMIKDNKRELHESGIIYCNRRPYMLTIMTKGYNPKNLAGFISHVSDTIYKNLCF